MNQIVKFLIAASIVLSLLTACASQPTAPAAPSPTASPSPTPTPPFNQTLASFFTREPWWDHGFSGVQGGGYEGPNFFPTGLAVAPDGTFFAATAAHSYIFHFDPYGKVLAAWGGYQKVNEGEKAPPGVFNEPWGVALSPAGFVFISDLWNSRIQKFSLDGKFLAEWGRFVIGNEPYGLFGPRGLALDSTGRLLVADTGNHRVVVYDQDGKFISQVGELGAALGQFNEPVAVAVDNQGRVFVSEAWNRRIQVLKIDANGAFVPLKTWPVDGWGSQEIHFKPMLCVHQGHVFATDPEHNLILEFTPEGELVKTLTMNSVSAYGKGAVTGIASDPTGGVWVSDITNNGWYHIKP